MKWFAAHHQTPMLTKTGELTLRRLSVVQLCGRVHSLLLRLLSLVIELGSIGVWTTTCAILRRTRARLLLCARSLPGSIGIFLIACSLSIMTGYVIQLYAWRLIDMLRTFFG